MQTQTKGTLADLMKRATRPEKRTIACPYCSHRAQDYPRLHKHIIIRHPRKRGKKL